METCGNKHPLLLNLLSIETLVVSQQRPGIDGKHWVRRKSRGSRCSQIVRLLSPYNNTLFRQRTLSEHFEEHPFTPISACLSTPRPRCRRYPEPMNAVTGSFMRCSFFFTVMHSCCSFLEGTVKCNH